MLAKTFTRLTVATAMALSVTSLFSCSVARDDEEDIVVDESLVSALKQHGIALEYHYDKVTTTAWIKQRPGTTQGYDVLRRISTLEFLVFDYPAEDQDLVNASKCTQINALATYDGRYTPEGLWHLMAFKKLKKLSLEDSNLTDEGLGKLQNLTTLEQLDLDGTKITGKGLMYLNKMQRLKYLDLSKTAVDDAGLAHISDLKSLKGLFLVDTAVSGAGLTHLRNLENLERLMLNNSNVSDEGLSDLRHLTSLKMLSLSGTKITDAAVNDLLAINNKKRSRVRIDLTDTQMTSKGIDALRKARPLWSIAYNNDNIKGDVPTEK